jgi:hypothetical protein
VRRAGRHIPLQQREDEDAAAEREERERRVATDGRLQRKGKVGRGRGSGGEWRGDEEEHLRRTPYAPTLC